MDNLAGFSTNPDFAGWESSFYFAPIDLEQCPEQDIFLGCKLFAQNGSLQCQYVVHKEPWRYVSPNSAGSINRILTSLNSRSSAAHVQSFPNSQKIVALTNLAHIYSDMGFNKLAISEIIRKFIPEFSFD